MQKEKILSELYHGNLNPVAKSVVQGSKYQKYQHEVADLEEELLGIFDEQCKEKFQAYITAQDNLNHISGEERFTDGFRMGAKIILEIFEKDGEQFKPIAG